MKTINKELLFEDADSLSIAEYLGMEIVKKGSYNFIRCPGHEKRIGKPDNAIGNCILTPKGYRCFACNASVDIIGMVMEYTGCGYGSALETIAEACGGVDYYLMDESDERIEREKLKRNTLSKDDIELIGLSPTHGKNSFSGKFVVNASDEHVDREEIEGYASTFYGGKYLIYRRVNEQSIQELYVKNETAYNDLIARKAKEAMEKYKLAVDEFCSRDSKKAGTMFELFNDNGSISNEVFQGLKNAFMKKYWRCKEIYEVFSSETKK